MGWTFYNSSGQQLKTSAFNVATQTEMESGTSVSVNVTPGRTQYHPGVAKLWVSITAAGLIESPDYNVDSVTDTGTGNRTVVITTDFSGIVYAITDGGDFAGAPATDTRAVGSFRIRIFNESSALEDRLHYAVAFGDQ